MSFALSIKQELIAKQFAVENAQALIAGLVAAAGQVDGEFTTVRIINKPLLALVKSLVKQVNLPLLHEERNSSSIIFANYEAPSHIKFPAYYFAGAFIGGGSIADLTTSAYHLELQMYAHANALHMLSFLNRYNFGFALIQRRKMWVLYLKKSEAISDFLRAIEAFNSLMAFENARIERDFKNQLNRYSNLDVYNQSKLAKASNQFKKYYSFIAKQKLENLFTTEELIFFELKKTHPLSSLDELRNLIAKKYQINKTRGGLNHWLLKLRRIYTDKAELS